MCRDISYIKKCKICDEKFETEHNNRKYCPKHAKSGPALAYFKTRKGRKKLSNAVKKYNKTAAGKAMNRKKYAANRDKYIAIARKWYLKNKARLAEQSRLRYHKKKQQLLDEQKEKP